MTKVAALEVGADGLGVSWAGGAGSSRYPWLWLRDHGHEPATLHPVTLQRQLDTAALPEAIRGSAACLAADGAAIEIAWSTGEQSTLPLAFLWRFREPRGAVEEPAVERVHWDAATIAERLPRIAHEAVMAGDEGLERWLSAVLTFGFCLVEGVPATPADSAALARRIGYLRTTIFGDLWDFTADLAKADTAYTDLELRPHTDATYALDAPGLQLFHCLEFSGAGGESVLVDGFRIADELRRGDPQAYATLSSVEVTGQYLGDGAHLMASRPVFRHEHGLLVQVTFNNYDRAPFRLPDDAMRAFYRALRSFERLANDPRLQWVHPLRPGEVLLFDNWRTLHGAARPTRGRGGCAAPTSTARTSTAACACCASGIAPNGACLGAGFGRFCSPMHETVISEARSEGDRDLAFAIRREVFVVEQRIGEALEFDGRDGAARHLLARRSGLAVGSLRLRLLEHGRVAKIERVAVRAAARGHKVGHALLEAALVLARAAGAMEARLHAQCAVQGFYGALGFVAEGPVFIEDGIPYVAMRRDLEAEEPARWRS